VSIDLLSQCWSNGLDRTITLLATSSVIFALWFHHCNTTVWSGFFFLPKKKILTIGSPFCFPAVPRLSCSGIRGSLLRWCTQTSPIDSAHISFSSPARIVKAINFRVSAIPTFYPRDLERLKDTNKWLSDSHVTFSLVFVPSLCVLSSSHSKTGIHLAIAPRKISWET